MSRKVIDLTGQRFGMLVVKERCGYIQKNTKQPTWLCVCDCGSSVVAVGYQLRNGTQQSCGCLRSKNATTHGLTGTPEYTTWRGMNERCNNPNNSHYPKYGGRGIGVCERWNSFENFIADMGKRPLNHSLERKENDKGYEPDNCKWAPPVEQSRNTSRSIKITFGSETLCLKDWSERLGITDGALKHRLKKWSFEKAMTTQKILPPSSDQLAESEVSGCGNSEGGKPR